MEFLEGAERREAAEFEVSELEEIGQKGAEGAGEAQATGEPKSEAEAERRVQTDFQQVKPKVAADNQIVVQWILFVLSAGTQLVIPVGNGIQNEVAGKTERRAERRLPRHRSERRAERAVSN